MALQIIDRNIIVLTQKKILSSNDNRKRPIQPDLWKDSQSKSLKLHGLPYVSRNGDEKDAKEEPNVAKVCAVRCQFEGCLTDLQNRQDIFKGYHKMDTYEAQRNYLVNLIERDEPRPNETAVYRYFINVRGRRMQTCKLTFLDTFRLGRGVIKTLQDKIAGGNVFIKDGRGQLGHIVINNADVVAQIQAHIAEFPHYETHYSRRQNGDFYLHPDLNLSRMFKMFLVSQFANMPHPEHKETLYGQIFHKTGLKFGVPRSDTCKECDRMNVQLQIAPNDEAREEIKEKIRCHHVTVDLPYKDLENDIKISREDPDYVVLCGDLQQVLFTPTLTHDEVFYKRQLSNYNYCIYEARMNRGHMFIWNETEGARGVEEVVSCLKELVGSLGLHRLRPNQERTLVFWSDRCRGQTNNNYFVAALNSLVFKDKLFSSTRQKFLCSGHSFLPCDRLFAQIEKRKKVCPAMVPDDLVRIIRETKTDGNPFIIHEMRRIQFLNIKSLESRFPRPNDLRVTEFAQFRIDRDLPGMILARLDFHDGVWQRFIVRAPGQRGLIERRAMWTPRDMLNFRFRPTHRNPIPISREKYQDLVSMIPYLLPPFDEYYRNLPHL